MDSAPNLLISSTDSFRYDINALLAIAVIAVVLFHFQVPGFSGGSVGVDIFFVISGFLMTSIIVTGLQTQHDGGKSFSLSNFNLARARRILPALIVPTAALLSLGWHPLPLSSVCTRRSRLALDNRQLRRYLKFIL